jgi:hypothetical protein
MLDGLAWPGEHCPRLHDGADAGTTWCTWLLKAHAFDTDAIRYRRPVPRAGAFAAESGRGRPVRRTTLGPRGAGPSSGADDGSQRPPGGTAWLARITLPQIQAHAQFRSRLHASDRSGTGQLCIGLQRVIEHEPLVHRSFLNAIDMITDRAKHPPCAIGCKGC